MAMRPPAQPSSDDLELAGRIARSDQAAFETVMRRHNGKLFRVARAILKDDAAAEDVLQEAYLHAYQNIATFRGGSRLGSWLTRIVINEALMRLRKQKRDRVVVPFADHESGPANGTGADVADPTIEPPSDTALRGEIRRILERRIDDLPVAFRTVFVMRDIEDMTVEETAECLGIPSATVRTRLFRARALLRNALARDLDAATLDVFGFAGTRCDRIVSAVLARVSATPDSGSDNEPA
jgi:RNA polymerase sigma-70 factor (ECF subfamily)